MTAKLEAVFKKVSALPPEQQDMIADQLLAELEDERLWDEKFAGSQNLLENMAQDALKNFNTGKTINKGWDEI